MNQLDKNEIESRIKLAYPTECKYLLDSDALIYKTRTKEQIIMPHKWWINRNTSVGEDAELWKRMSNNGRRELHFNNVVGVYRKTEFH